MTDLADPGTLFDRVPCLAGTPRAITPLPGGLTNRNYKVTTPDGRFVARVWADGDLLAIDRDHEHHNSVAAAAPMIQAITAGQWYGQLAGMIIRYASFRNPFPWGERR